MKRDTERTRRGQPVADPNRMRGTSLPVWLRFRHPSCSGEPLVARHRLAPTPLRDETLVQRQNLPKAEIHDVPKTVSPWRELGEKEKIGIKRVISRGG